MSKYKVNCCKKNILIETGLFLSNDSDCNTYFSSTDIDECSDGSLHMCTQHCIDTVGSHHCDCYVGYELEPDGFTCTGESTINLCSYRLMPGFSVNMEYKVANYAIQR